MVAAVFLFFLIGSLAVCFLVVFVGCKQVAVRFC